MILVRVTEQHWSAHARRHMAAASVSQPPTSIILSSLPAGQEDVDSNTASRHVKQGTNIISIPFVGCISTVDKIDKLASSLMYR